MAETFESLGRQIDAALDHDDANLATLLAERDALLAELTAALSTSGLPNSRSLSMTQLSTALESASATTSTLIAKVAERTDALRSALRDVTRNSRATNGYQVTSDTSGFVNARR